MSRKFTIEDTEYVVKIMKIDRSERVNLFNTLMEYSGNDYFYNINEDDDDEISLIIDDRIDMSAININEKIKNSYRVIKIHENRSGVNHVGVVTEISSLFTDINIPIMYLNTYSYNFILVKKKDHSKAMKAIQSLL